MKINLQNSVIVTLLILAGFCFFGCKCPFKKPRPLTFDSADNPGEAVTITVGTETVKLIYANNKKTITFPVKTGDSDTATLNRKFFIAETEVTNAVYATVLQWALDNGKISETGSHNSVNESRVKYGNMLLIYLDSDYVTRKISYNTSTNLFAVAAGYENYPVNVNWYGAIMFCNWLTEMKDGTSDNIVYTGITSSLDENDIIENAVRIGYRLPTSAEWEYSARYIGKTKPTVEDLASECVYFNKGGGFLSLTSDYYWTPGDYLSGAIKDYTNEMENYAVAWCDEGENNVKEVAGKRKNQLGLFDMSGNMCEWCFSVGWFGRACLGGDVRGHAVGLATEAAGNPEIPGYVRGFRIARTQ